MHTCTHARTHTLKHTHIHKHQNERTHRHTYTQPPTHPHTNRCVASWLAWTEANGDNNIYTHSSLLMLRRHPSPRLYRHLLASAPIPSHTHTSRPQAGSTRSSTRIIHFWRKFWSRITPVNTRTHMYTCSAPVSLFPCYCPSFRYGRMSHAVVLGNVRGKAARVCCRPASAARP